MLLTKQRYILIDALYFDDLKKNILENKNQINLNEIRKNVFPYMNSPFAEYVGNLESKCLKPILMETDNSFNDLKTLSSDTGVILIVNVDKIYDIIKDYNYDNIIDNALNDMPFDSLKKGIRILDKKCILYKNEFSGGGTFRIIN